MATALLRTLTIKSDNGSYRVPVLVSTRLGPGEVTPSPDVYLFGVIFVGDL